MNIGHLGILADIPELTFTNEFSELCTRASAGPPYAQGSHSFMYKNTHHAVPNRRRGGMCPEMCGVNTVRTGRVDHLQGSPGLQGGHHSTSGRGKL